MFRAFTSGTNVTWTNNTEQSEIKWSDGTTTIGGPDDSSPGKEGHLDRARSPLKSDDELLGTVTPSSTVMRPQASRQMAAPESPFQHSPLMGWSAWKSYHFETNETDVQRAADGLLSSGMHGRCTQYTSKLSLLAIPSSCSER